MDKQVREIIDFTREKLGLTNYTLKRHEIFREKDRVHDTSYLLNMEWFPNGVKQIDEDYNPSGTLSVDIDMHNLNIRSIVFVQGISYAEEAPYPAQDKQEVIEWIEQMTGLKYEQHFKLIDDEDDSFRFQATINDIILSPAGIIEIEFNFDGQLSLFSIHGNFPKENAVKQESFSLTLDSVEDIAKKQCKLVNFPDDIKKRWLPIYGLEEVYVTNDHKKILPFEAIEYFPKPIMIDKILEWDQSISEEYTYEDIDLSREVTLEQALNKEADPNTFPITESEQKLCIAETKRFLQREYANDSGKWTLKRLFRDSGYIIAEVKPTVSKNDLMERKIKVIIHSENLQVANFIDNNVLVDMFAHFQEADKVTISQESAFQQLRKHIKIIPVYVYDPGLGEYILCGKLDSDYGVNATNGDIVLLDDI